VLVFSSPKSASLRANVLAANVLAANVMDIRSFAALKKASGVPRSRDPGRSRGTFAR